jgi:drug/metabolite transporter (DMT)-like permease
MDRASIGWFSLILSFYALRNATQADVTIISKTAPLFITIFSAIFLKESIPKAQFSALALVLISALMVSRPSFNSSFLPLLAAFGSAVTSSISYTLLRYFKGKVDGMTVILYFSAFSTLVSMPFSFFTEVRIPDGRQFLLLLVVGITGSLGQIGLTYSYRMVKAAEVSIYDQSSIPFSVLLGYLLLGEQPRLLSILGGLLIILASSYLVYSRNRPKSGADRE